MKTIVLDVHAELSQLDVISEQGEVMLEMQVPTRPEDLRRIVSGVPGRKRVVLEHGPMSGLIHPERPGVPGDALKDLADEIVSADPTRNALIARSESSTDEGDARHLGRPRPRRRPPQGLRPRGALPHVPQRGSSTTT